MQDPLIRAVHVDPSDVGVVLVPVRVENVAEHRVNGEAAQFRRGVKFVGLSPSTLGETISKLVW